MLKATGFLASSDNHTETHHASLISDIKVRAKEVTGVDSVLSVTFQKILHWFITYSK
jgi:hypothetical protein